MPVQEKVREVTEKWVWPRPLTFEAFLDAYGPKDFVELIDGSVVEKRMVQLAHEKLLLWLLSILHPVVKRKGLGIVLGSRSAVKISKYRGRLPDLFFVRQERIGIVEEKATYGAPDLVIEIVSPGDRPSDVIALETDYQTIGVSEIVFIDQKKRNVRVLRKTTADYEEATLITGALVLESLGGLSLELTWLFDEPRPDEHDMVARLST